MKRILPIATFLLAYSSSLWLGACASQSPEKFSYSEILELEEFRQNPNAPKAKAAPRPVASAPSAANSAPSARRPASLPTRGKNLTLQRDCGVYAEASESSQILRKMSADKVLWVTPGTSDGWYTVQRASGPAAMPAACFDF